jgi:NAD(P)-dependent dehydrogenase (short-subunit alcohol dehydrogenase family)
MEATGTAVVTGASRGIGRAVAVELARRGFDVVATMRNPDAGKTLADEIGADALGTLTVQRLDVTDPDSIVYPDSLTVLVNNAATEAEHPAFEDTPLQLWRDMFETNVFGLIEATRRALPLLRANGGGVICNVTSSSLLAPMPFYGPYRGSKAVISAIGESLQAEVKPFGIRVVEIMPGPIDTDMLAEGGGPVAASESPVYGDLGRRVNEMRSGAWDATPTATAAIDIADAILDDESPLRVGCDPMSVAMIEAWRNTSDQVMIDGFINGMYPEG